MSSKHLNSTKNFEVKSTFDYEYWHKEVADFEGFFGGSGGWDLPPPPLNQGINKNCFRKVKEWTLKFQRELLQGCAPEHQECSIAKELLCSSPEEDSLSIRCASPNNNYLGLVDSRVSSPAQDLESKYLSILNYVYSQYLLEKEQQDGFSTTADLEIFTNQATGILLNHVSHKLTSLSPENDTIPSLAQCQNAPSGSSLTSLPSDPGFVGQNARTIVTPPSESGWSCQEDDVFRRVQSDRSIIFVNEFEEDSWFPLTAREVNLQPSFNLDEEEPIVIEGNSPGKVLLLLFLFRLDGSFSFAR